MDATAGRVVWDRWVGNVSDPVMSYADIGFIFDYPEYRCEPKPKEIAEPPMYRYHTERFRAFYGCAEPIGKVYRHKVDEKSGMLTIDTLNEVMSSIYQDMNTRNMGYPRKLTLNAPSPSFVSEAVSILATAYGRFVQAGRQIMDFPPSLVEMLAKTDVSDIPLDSIKMPYASQYLYFGPQADMELEPGWLVDGAYVEERGEPGDIRFTITAVPSDRSLSRLWFVHPEPVYTQDFVGDYRKMDLATAMDTVLSDKLAGLNKRRSSQGGDITEQLRREADASGEDMHENTQIIDISPQMADERLAQVNRRHPVYSAALQLVVNALCYVTAYPDDIDTVWPAGTPETLKAKAEAGKGKEVMRAKSKLAALGYVPVHVCGKKIDDQRSKAAASATHGQSHHASHWRRGHWRNQVHGPARSLRKLIWVMPVLVGASQRDEPELGHLYLVS